MREILLLEANFTDATKYFVVGTAVVLCCTIVGIPLMIIVLPLIWISKSIEYKHIRCELYEMSLKVNRGWLNKVEKTIPLEKITDLAVSQGPIMRYMGVEAIQVETAGQSGTGSSLVHLVGITDARGFRDAVLDQRDRVVAGSHKADRTDPPALARTADDGATLTEIRDILARIEGKLDERS